MAAAMTITANATITVVAIVLMSRRRVADRNI
jgi:hypothetical protein